HLDLGDGHLCQSDGADRPGYLSSARRRLRKDGGRSAESRSSRQCPSNGVMLKKEASRLQARYLHGETRSFVPQDDTNAWTLELGRTVVTSRNYTHESIEP